MNKRDIFSWLTSGEGPSLIDRRVYENLPHGNMMVQIFLIQAQGDCPIAHIALLWGL